jgi:hypothetical protein
MTTPREGWDEEDNDGGAKEDEAEQGDGVEAKEEQILANLHGYWVKCHVKDVHIQALDNEGLVLHGPSPNGGRTTRLWFQLRTKQRF